MTSSSPLVSIIIVNFNGMHFLNACLSSIHNLEFRNFEVICVDNSSTDGSVPYMRENFPWVKIIPSEKNLGFAGGNNLGIREATGKYIILLNNDTVVDSKWLTSLVKTAESDPSIGAVGSKIVFYRKFIPIIFSTHSFSPKARGHFRDSRRLGFKLLDTPYFSGEDYQKVFFDAGFYDAEYDATQKNFFRWTTGTARIFIPYNETSSDDYVLELYAAGHEEEKLKQIDVIINGKIYSSFSVSSEFEKQTILLDRETAHECSVDIINNAGSYLRPYGIAGDIGFSEVDHGQFEQVRETRNLCGCSVLINRRMLADIGLLDERFFMYFEDTDLFWRAWKKKWKLIFCPSSIVRHYHTGSSKEWSPFFTYYVHRNRYLLVLKNGSFGEVLITGCSLIIPLIQEIKKTLNSLMFTKDAPSRSWEKTAALVMVIFSSIFNAIPVLYERFTK